MCQTAEKILSILPNATLPGISIVPIILISMSIAGILLLRRKPRTLSGRITEYLLYTCTLLSGLFLISGGIVWYTGTQHGMYQINLTCQDILNGIHHSPIETPLPSDQSPTQCLIIYYRFGCSDCESIYQELAEQLTTSDNQNIYWVSTRSKQGENLRKSYPVSKVPSGVYIKGNGHAVTLPLYDKTDDGHATPSTENIQTLLTMLNEQI